jgi:acetyl esterase/lipase
MNNKKLFALFTLSILSLNILTAQEVIKIWEDKIPESIYNSEYKELVNEKRTTMRKVSEPTLTAFIVPKEKATGTAVVICPGGSYSWLAFAKEGTRIAKWFNSFGVSAFVLKYRLPNNKIMKNKTIGPLQDAQKAIRLIRRKAAQYNVNKNKIGIVGFSAGGHLAATASTHFNKKVYTPVDTTSARPSFSILLYPVVSMQEKYTHKGSRNNLLGKNPSKKIVDEYSNELMVTEQTPPAFIVHAANDKIVKVENSINYFLALQKNGVPAEMHIYETGKHGFGLGKKKETNANWPKACKNWMLKHKFL